MVAASPIGRSNACSSMTAHELGVWLTLGVLLAAPFLLLVPVRGGNGHHAHAGPGTLTVAQLHHAIRGTPTILGEIVTPTTTPSPGHQTPSGLSRNGPNRTPPRWNATSTAC
ncbi:hypothetical protein FHX42_004891 [Saccharopolyspora lacisalsi]|uniref:Uncharacterized protein n=1 Tax=Halosaccharopolyspora lacisalsi TaxID=1000566 RepID=A0A839E6I4_9PSEU|nr:hypothetical protein [Halosaccharopolyspora lacisalsi]MBA8827495.1 hypothetical protein [Halosaccharopolyspora lacisalsi]